MSCSFSLIARPCTKPAVLDISSWLAVTGILGSCTSTRNDIQMTYQLLAHFAMPAFARLTGASIWRMVQEQRQKAKEQGLERKRQKRTPELRESAKSFYKGLVADSDYQGQDYEVFSSWLGQTQNV